MFPRFLRLPGMTGVKPEAAACSMTGAVVKLDGLDALHMPFAQY